MAKHTASRRWPASLGITALATVLGTIVALFVGAGIASAASNVSNVSFTGATQAAGATTNWTVGFTTSSGQGALASGNTITVAFASGFTVLGSPTATLGSGFSHCSATATTPSSGVVTITLANSGGTCALGKGVAATLIIGAIGNPTTAGSYTNTNFSVRTSADGAASPSSNVVITAAAASKLAFVQGPTELAAGSTFSPAITVQVQDQFGNAVASSGLTVTLSSSAGPLDGGSTATTSASGLATFGSAQINTAAAGLTLTAAASGLTSATSGSFNVVVLVTNGIPLTDTATDSGSGVKSVSYYYCAGYSGACTNGTLIGTATNATNNYLFTWAGQPANGQYRLVVVGIDNVTNTSLPSASIPIRIAN
jgi:hypothetical protein